jgi:formylglycine-generating enzyme required for sulfatase activity
VAHASRSLESPAAETTIAVLLGASEYPQKPAWSNPVLGTSARAFRDYLLAPTGLSLTPGQVLDLFDAAAGAADQLFQIKEFLKKSGTRARDLIVYYVGHGGFDNDDYYLGIRNTQHDHEFITTIESRKLARIIREGFGRKRVYVILDSCFAASAAPDWQGDEIEAAVRKMSQPLPRQGTAFLAAASKYDVTRAPRAERYTVFSGAVLEALAHGVDRAQPRISLYELYEEVRDRLQRRETDEEARPELHTPSQREGDVARLGLFPNAAYPRIAEANRVRAEVAARAAVEVAARAAVEAAEQATVRARDAAAARTEAEVARRDVARARDQPAGRVARLTPRIEPRLGRRKLVAIGSAAIVGLGVTAYAITRRGRDPSLTPAAMQMHRPIEASASSTTAPSNTWVRVTVPATPILLGIESDSAPETVRGFRPARKITSPRAPYEIQEHEVTWSEIEPWLASSHTPLAFPPWAADPVARASLPVTGVTWSIALAYCKLLGGSLPGEEQWEYAARGAGRRPNSWGADRLDPRLTLAYAGPRAIPAAVKANMQDQTPEPAVYDLIGNVQEWTLGLWREDMPGADESWVESGTTSIRAIRGLPLGDEPPPSIQTEAAAYREQLCATGPCVDKGAELRRYVGFRCAKAVAP